MSKDPDQYNAKEAQARFEEALKGLKTSPKPLKDKPKVKKAVKRKKWLPATR
jgi:hypothetical protein